ncbi:PREDICTED: leukocyte immunoglobulin-like receptor subfamily A member 6-like [Elephantulus edwardii]|uniref:leukocyte immunoglobulin-like receptor subfamily A member 6-like n=1 Tax=Elephantulus edwardii TaxID=28737 RepID=UPI0003F07905|nr:PREDICTED: leukocyte immunoglobulin-like receptor subfamily A member 6-like [Elephantulus edwardii]
MTVGLVSLLCLGFSLSQRIRAQHETLPKPTLWAEPRPLIYSRHPGAIWCQASLEAQRYLLSKEGSPEPWDTQQPLEPRDKAKFLIVHMTVDYAGRYHCQYCTQSGCSARSDVLELVMTGDFDKPTLTAVPVPGEAPGGKMSLQCGSRLGFDRFVLLDEGDPRRSWTLDSQQLSSGRYQAVFPVDPVTSHRRTFRCYGYFRTQPYMWSDSSDILEFPDTGEEPGPRSQMT